MTEIKVLQRSGSALQEVTISTDTTSTNKEVIFFIGGSPIQAGDSVSLFFGGGVKIDSFALLTNDAATVELDIRAVSAAALPADSGDSICGEKPALNNAYMVSDSTLVDWVRTVEPGSVLVATVTSVTGTVRNLTLQLNVLESIGDIPILYFTSTELDMSPPTFGIVRPYASSVTYNLDERILYPTYDRENSPAALVFDAGEDAAVDQWVAHERDLIPSSGAAPYTYVVTGLPTGMTYERNENMKTLEIRGVPETTGVATISIQVTDRLDRVTSDSYDLTVSSATKKPVITGTFPFDQLNTDADQCAIVGYNFGTSGTLTIDSTTITTLAWADTHIEFVCPTGLSASSDISVTSGGQTSNTVTRDVL